MSFLRKLFASLILLLIGGIVYHLTPTYAATSPYDVESSVIGGWWNTYGSKTFDMRTGNNLVYDVYANKYTQGGYTIVNKNFGQGSQPYINFQGWAINFGYYQHTATNQETYIVATNNQTGINKVYGTLPINISATEDVEYNNQGAGVWNECSATATSKSNIPSESNGCNMRYDSVGFDAYIPLNELFPDPSSGSSWRLYIVKRVNSHIIYSELILPFTFDDQKFNGGEISLSSGINANLLRMVGTSVIRRNSAHCTTCDGSTLGYFSTGSTYTHINTDESWTAVWYGVSDSGSTRWASTSYWGFGGDQANIKYDAPPQHVSNDISGYRYQNGNNYWVQPNDNVQIRLRQRDLDTGNKYGYLRLLGSGVDVRSMHDFRDSNLAYNYQFRTDPSVSIYAASREENSGAYATVLWSVSPKVHGHNYDIEYYYTDLADNYVGYNSTGMHLLVDGVTPFVSFRDNADTFNYTSRDWSNNSIDVRMKFGDSDSGYNASRYQWSTSTATPSNWSGWSNSSNYLVSKSSFGEWYLHVQVVDNVGNVLTTYSGPYKFNNNPVASFSPSPTNIYNDTLVTFYNYSWDEDGNALTYKWEYQSPGTSSWVTFSTAVNPTKILNIKGTWNIRLSVSDGIGNDSISIPVTVQNRPPKAGFTTNQTSYYKSDMVIITSAATDPDNDSLTYVYEITKPNGQKFTFTSVNPTFNNLDIGFYTIKQTVTDTSNASASITKQIEVVNRKPVLELTYSPTDPYEGDLGKICVHATDEDNQLLSYKIFITKNGSTEQTVLNMSNLTSGSTECYSTTLVPGRYDIRAEVNDGYDTVTESTWFYAKPLILIGNVLHTPDWESKHQSLGHATNQFYSGETFLLEATTSPYPIEYVKSTLHATQADEQPVVRTVTMSSASTTLYQGELYDELFQQYPTNLKVGPASFEFEVKYSNGVIKQDTVNVQIIDNVFDAFLFHRTY